MQKTGLLLISAAVLFWLAWLMMPGVGVTDARQIFTLVSTQRSLVMVSVVIQLISAVLYVPALLGVVLDVNRSSFPTVQRWSGLLIVGAMGSAADAVLHLLAFAMTAPGLEIEKLISVMEFMQGPGLILLAPLILCFFLGGGGLSWIFSKNRLVSPWNFRLHLIAIVIAVFGGLLATRGLIPSRVVGLVALGIISAAQVWIGIAFCMRSVSEKVNSLEHVSAL
ncbi:MAG TPA: hypothetical protein PKY82_30450 [Pyrinomonadaceae bacterium]|nr:hypothetical protein [Pyrinomonadaceae bacterium]